MNIKKLLLTTICLIVVGTCVELGAQTRIRFAKGRSSATVPGSIGPNARRTYVLGAKQGQSLSGNVSSQKDCVKFTDGSTSLSFITESGNNVISLTNYCSRALSFTMTISINYGSD